jgi:hypothetical protein
LTPVLGVRVPNHKGGLAKLLRDLDKEDINIEYAYCFAVNSDYAIDILKINDETIEAKLAALGYVIVDEDELYRLD